MLFKSKELKGYKLGARDGFIGAVNEFYFDDKHWTIRYLVADTGNWLTNRKVLISPYALQSIDVQEHVLEVDLTMKHIELSPSLDCDRPVSRQFELDYYGHYGWPLYWSGFYPWGASPYIVKGGNDSAAAQESYWDPHLRSTQDMAGYHIQAVDGEVGHVKDFIIDDQTWAIRYLVVETGTWLSGRQVLISPPWIEGVSWVESKVFVSLSQQQLRNAPEYSEQSLLDRTYEAALHDHYGRDRYWDDEASRPVGIPAMKYRSKDADHRLDLSR